MTIDSDRTPLYQQIAESVRQELLYGNLGPGDRLPTVRSTAARWHCTAGTVQRAYRELARQGLVVSRSGQGTRVAAALEGPQAGPGPWRRAHLVNLAERFLLGTLAAGYSAGEAERALQSAVDRWRTLEAAPAGAPERVLRFAGSHDPALSLIAARFGEIAPGFQLDLKYRGSLGGLMALAEGEADLAGCHLWDAESDTYNRPFVCRLLPGREVALLTLAHRRLGLVVAPSNPLQIGDLGDLARPGLRLVNRQRGAGTRVWLDAHLRSHGVDPDRLDGYGWEVLTHAAVAAAVAEDQADVGLAVEAAALAYGLDFLPLARERYDLVILRAIWELAPVQTLAAWLNDEAAQATIRSLGGYDTAESGRVAWVR
jgi:molybdate-binding protein/DNA-binding transcriptional regulator YhcF (GntR family)